MKLKKLFKKIEKFFSKNEDKKSSEKRIKLITSLENKIDSMKDRIKDLADNKDKKDRKKELKVLMKLKDKLLKEQEL